jgi:4-hydroxybenzoate polyprenyl transferase
MRSLGCIVNDYADRSIDAKINRTKDRPLAAGIISTKQALVFAGILLFAGFLIFLVIPLKAKAFAIFSAALMVLYPYTKRFTFHPQVFLGIAFNSTIFVSAACMDGGMGTDISVRLIYMFLCGICWTVAYDTIYAFQDLRDDQAAHVKSTAVRYENAPKPMVGLWYFAGGVFLVFAKGVDFGFLVYSFFAAINLWFWVPQSKKSCGKIFNAHGVFGFFGGL